MKHQILRRAADKVKLRQTVNIVNHHYPPMSGYLQQIVALDEPHELHVEVWVQVQIHAVCDNLILVVHI